MFISSDTLFDKVTYFLANLYESVEIHSNLSSFILKLIPVNIGLVSCDDIAKDVLLIKFLNSVFLIIIGSFFSSIFKLGNSAASIEFKLNSEFPQEINTFILSKSSILTILPSNFLIISNIYLP